MRSMESTTNFVLDNEHSHDPRTPQQQHHQPPPISTNQDEMTLLSMIVIGISCGIFACIIFTICSERWDFFITKKILGRDSTRGGNDDRDGDRHRIGGGGRGRNRDGDRDRASETRRQNRRWSQTRSNLPYLHNDERSSDLSELVNEWESASDDSVDDGSSAKEHGYWINAMIQELTAYKPSLTNDNAAELNMLPPLQTNESASCETSPRTRRSNTSGSTSSSTSTNKSTSASKSDEITIDKEHCGSQQDAEDAEVDSKVAMVEPWLINAKDEDAPLCKTIRKLLRVASDCNEDDCSKYSSSCSSLSFSDDTGSKNAWESGHEHRVNGLLLNSVESTVEETQCNSDDSTVACGNVGKKRCSTGIRTEDTMDITDSEDSLERGGCGKVRNVFIQNLELWKERRLFRSVSIVIPMISGKRNDEIQSNDSCDSDSSLTVSDDDSQYGMIDGREEV